MKIRNFVMLMGMTGVAATAAAAVVLGEVRDGAGESLPGVAAQLVNAADSTRAGYVLTDADGRYEFKNIKPGTYALKLTMTGMDDIDKSVIVKSDADTVRVNPSQLTENSVMLKETVVTAVRAAVVAKEDTLEFNAGSFHTGPTSSVEDLLKKLPGVEVASDGSITSGGKTISKILVDGKEFFADDPKMASKNLPSNMVDKVQVVDRKSELARLTGVDDGEDETVINLTVKKDMNQGWFGNVSAGYGTGDRYQGSFNVNWFKNGNQLSFIGGTNNVNDMGFTDMGRGNFRNFGGDNGINTTRQFGINFNIGNEEKFRVGGNVLYTNSDRIARSRSNTQYLFPDSVSFQNSGSRTRDRGNSLRAQFRMRWNISEADILDFRPEFTANWRRSELNDSSLLYNELNDVNRSFAMRSNRGFDYNLSGRLIYTHKFLSRPGRSISATVNYRYSNNSQQQTSWNDIVYYLSQDDSELLYQFIDSRQWSNYVEGRLTWTEPLGDPARGNYLEVAYKASLRFNNADKLTYDIPADGFDPEVYGLTSFKQVPDGALLNDTLSNRFRNRFSNQELQIGYKKTNKMYNLNAGIIFSPSSSGSEDLINSNRNIKTRWVYNVAPYARFRYKFSKTTSLRADYRARTSQPSLTQLQPVADYSNPLNVVVGNPDLKPTFSQNIGLHFNHYNTTTQQSIFAVANAGFSINNVVSKTVSDPSTGVRTTTYVNANGNWNVFGMAMINQPLRNKKWRFNARLHANYSSTAGYINGDFNRSGNLRISPTLGMTFSSDIFQMTLSPRYSYSIATSTLPQQRDRNTNSYGFNTDVSLYLPFGLDVSTDLAFDKSTGFSSGFDNTQWLWNAQISYSVLSDKSLTFSVRGYDLLGMKKNISRSVSASQITDNEYNDLERYVMFSVTWKFNTLKKKASSPDPDGFGPRGPIGPPPGERTRGGGNRGGRGGGRHF